MIQDIDGAIRTIITREVLGAQDGVDVDFEAPTADWAARRNTPTINVYLYDITEDTKRRQVGAEPRRDGDTGFIEARMLPARRFQLAYLVTAWTQRPEDEHRLLGALLGAFLRHPALPTEMLTDELRAMDVVIPVTICLPRPEPRRAFDVWSSLGGELKPSLDLVIVAPLVPAPSYGEVGPPVLEDARFDWVGDDFRRRRGPDGADRRPDRPVETAETVYGGAAPATGRGARRSRASGFGDGRPGRALIVGQDPDRVRHRTSEEPNSDDADG